MQQRHRTITLLLAVSLLIAGLAAPAMAGPEGTLISKINSSRSASGLGPLESYWDLRDDARAHSGRMMDQGSIYHNSGLSGVTGVWEKLGENVGMGIDLNAMHSAFMQSSGHRANILGDYNYVGVGVKTDENGVHWVTVIFMKAAPGLNGGDTTTTTTTQAPATTTTTVAPVTTTTTQPPATTTTTVAPSQETSTSGTTPPATKTIATGATAIAGIADAKPVILRTMRSLLWRTFWV